VGDEIQRSGESLAPLQRLFIADLQKLIEDRPFLSPSEKRLVDLERKLWHPVIGDPNPCDLERDDFFYQMTRFPKVSFVNFNRRAFWEAGQTEGLVYDVNWTW